MNARIKRCLKAPFHWLGVDVVRRRSHPLDFLRAYELQTVLDVGAYVGNFAHDMRRILPKATVHCFEPLNQQFARLQKRFAGEPSVHLWNFAVGDRERTATINITASAACSSLLPSKLAHQYFRQAQPASTQAVQVTTLDSWSAGKNLTGPVLLKIDVQGLEREVLQGAEATLGRVEVMILEVSFEELYGGQPLFAEIHAMAARSGFALRGMIEPVCHPRTGIHLQANAIFAREAAAGRILRDQAETRRESTFRAQRVSA